MNSPPPLHPSSLIFPSATNDIKTALTSFKRSNLSITNRLRSIARDADFVYEVARAYQLPLIANERCGSWYIPPERKQGSAYFKSTDGHFGQWSLSLRRLNLQVLDLVGSNRGCIIVDSTRRGKSMPDALSKTIPIWICVLNRLLFPEQTTYHELSTPADVVSESEHSQIEARLPSFVTGLRSLDLDLEALRAKLHDRPMRPCWVTPGSLLGCGLPKDVEVEGYHQVVLCTASSRSSEVLHHSTGYVQGAADDSESWAHGLSAATFWAHHVELLSTSEDELPGVIETLMAGARRRSLNTQVREPVLVEPTSEIWIADNAAAEARYEGFDVVVSCSEVASTILAKALKSQYIHLACSTGKIGSRQLRVELPKLESLRSVLQARETRETQVLVTCQTGKDLAVGVALAIICLLCDGNGIAQASFDANGPPAVISKALIKHRLSWIMVSIPSAAPSRATLQSVNAFLMG